MSVDYAAIARQFGGEPGAASPSGATPVSPVGQPGTQTPTDYSALAAEVRSSSPDINTPSAAAPDQGIGAKILSGITSVARAVAPLGESVGAALAAPGAKAMEADTAARQQQLSDTAARLIANPNLSTEAKRHALAALQMSQGTGVIAQSGAFNETPLQTVGKALGTAGTFLGGEGASAVGKLGVTGLKGLALKALAEGAVGAGTIGAGSALAQGKDASGVGMSAAGIGAVSAAIPILGEIIGKAVPAVARSLEKSSLRLSPTQKTDLFTKINGIADWIRNNNIVGTPESRFDKITNVYNGLEKTYQDFLATDAAGRTVARQDVIASLDALKANFVNDADSLAIDKQIDGIKKTLEKKFPEQIPVDRLNALKRSTYQQAYNQAGTKVRDDVEHAAADVYRQAIENATQGLTVAGKPVKEFNAEYGKAVMARKLMKMAMNKPEIGLVGRFIAAQIGGAIGSRFGGLAGTIGGEALGGTTAKMLVGTLPKSALSAGLTTAEKVAKPIGNALAKKGVPSVVQSLKAYALSSLAGGYQPTGQ